MRVSTAAKDPRSSVAVTLCTDLTPSEHPGDEFERRIPTRLVPPNNDRELENALEEEWRRIPANVVRRLLMLMGQR